MERDKVIKALECCPEQEYCGDCPYDNECMGMEFLILDALSLINSQEQDKEKLGLLIDEIVKEKRELFEENKMLTAENERLRADLAKANKDKQILLDDVASLEADVEKAVDIAEADVRAEIASGGTSCHWCEDKVRSDTVRKMQTEINKTLSALCKGDVSEIHRMIDQIAKEMLEDGA